MCGRWGWLVYGCFATSRFAAKSFHCKSIRCIIKSIRCFQLFVLESVLKQFFGKGLKKKKIPRNRFLPRLWQRLTVPWLSWDLFWSQTDSNHQSIRTAGPMRGSEFEADGCKLVLKNPFWRDNTSIVCYFKFICQQSHTVFFRLNAAHDQTPQVEAKLPVNAALK